MLLLSPIAASGAPLTNVIHNINALTFLRAMPAESVNCVVISPPYNLRNSTGGGLKRTNNKSLWANQPMRHGYDGLYTDDLPHDVYIEWQRECLQEMFRTIRSDGCIFYNHKWRVQGGILQRLADEITLGLPVRQIVIWNRGGGINFNEQYFLPSYEVIYLIAKPAFKLQPKTNAFMDVWQIPPVVGKEHPNAFPEQIVERCISAGCVDGGLVVDPFMGSGTTAVVAKLLGRDYIGSEINPKYIELANKRIAQPSRRRFDEASLDELPMFRKEVMSES